MMMLWTHWAWNKGKPCWNGSKLTEGIHSKAERGAWIFFGGWNSILLELLLAPRRRAASHFALWCPCWAPSAAWKRGNANDDGGCPGEWSKLSETKYDPICTLPTCAKQLNLSASALHLQLHRLWQASARVALWFVPYLFGCGSSVAVCTER